MPGVGREHRKKIDGATGIHTVRRTSNRWSIWKCAGKTVALAATGRPTLAHNSPGKKDFLIMLSNAPDLTQRPPRSPRVRLGGYVLLPRMLDKGRATLAGINGPYKYACPLDQRFLSFAGIDPEHLREQLALGKGDSDILEWVNANSATKPSEWQIAQWSTYIEQRAPGDVESREFFNQEIVKLGRSGKTSKHGPTFSIWTTTSVTVESLEELRSPKLSRAEVDPASGERPRSDRSHRARSGWSGERFPLHTCKPETLNCRVFSEMSASSCFTNAEVFPSTRVNYGVEGAQIDENHSRYCSMGRWHSSSQGG